MVNWYFDAGQVVALGAAGVRYAVPVESGIDGGSLAALLNAAPALGRLLLPPWFTCAEELADIRGRKKHP